MTLRIVVDQAVPWHREAFEGLGQVHAVPGAAIDNAVLRDADVLIVRSVTRVDAALLRGTAVRFVGSATAGEDHIDRRVLESAGITVARAPGCNAQAVAEYVLSALSHARRWGQGGPPGPVGVVGLGHVGRRTTRALRAVGYQVIACDPPLAERRACGEPIEDPDPALTNLARFERLVSLDELLESAFVITLHVPLVPAGRYATTHLLGDDELARLRHGQLVINTSRGGVIDDVALERWIAVGDGRALVDVWEGEPRPNPGLLRGPGATSLATPHIAGYTLDGKVAATTMVHEALCRWMSRAPRFDGSHVLGSPGSIDVSCTDPQASRDFRPWVAAAVPLTGDDTRLRSVIADPEDSRGQAFESLRRNYSLRRELSAFRIQGADLDTPTRNKLTALGFSVEGASPPLSSGR
ncbi:MAG: DUF3410 domain-containing protein [Deltaproteobacteria bacterium]|nr:DUF3410 domain-containing protein [Deltaproteobacteria bacterium]